MMNVAPGWYPDTEGQGARYWNGDSWGLAESFNGVGAGDARYRIYGQPGVSLSHSEFGDAAKSGAAGELRTAQALEILLEKYPQARLFHSVRLDGVAWDIDHVLVLGRVVFFIDAKNWRGGHDYLLQFDSYYDTPPGWQGNPNEQRFLRDRVLRWDRQASSEWEMFAGSVIRLRGMSERFALETGIGDASNYRFVPVLVVARDDVTVWIESSQPSWLQFTDLPGLESRIDEVAAAESRLADGEDPQLLAHFTRLQANAQTPSQQNPVHIAPAQVLTPVPLTYTPPYAQGGTMNTSSSGGNGMAVAGFIVGLVSIFLPLIFGLAAGITGLVLSIVGVSRARLVANGKGLAIAGIVLSALGTLLIL